jgi:hypothetical protein
LLIKKFDEFVGIELLVFLKEPFIETYFISSISLNTAGNDFICIMVDKKFKIDILSKFVHVDRI